jgi:membrane-bound lytic murein transglycosylase B
MSVSSGFDASDLTDVMKLRRRRRLCALVVLFVTACASSPPTPTISPTTSLAPPQGIAAPPAVGASASATASGDPVQAAGFADWVSRFRDTARAAGRPTDLLSAGTDAGISQLVQKSV